MLLHHIRISVCVSVGKELETLHSERGAEALRRSNLESAGFASRKLRRQLNILNARGRRPVAAPVDHLANIFRWALDHQLDPLVRQIAHPA